MNALFYGIALNKDEKAANEAMNEFLHMAAYARSAAGNPDALTDLEQYAADYDGDGTVALEDAFGILQAYSKNAAGNGCASGSV